MSSLGTMYFLACAMQEDARQLSKLNPNVMQWDESSSHKEELERAEREWEQMMEEHPEWDAAYSLRE